MFLPAKFGVKYRVVGATRIRRKITRNFWFAADFGACDATQKNFPDFPVVDSGDSVRSFRIL
jgi:hypothetical protein